MQRALEDSTKWATKTYMVALSSARCLQALVFMTAVGTATPAFGQQAPERQSEQAESEEGEKAPEGTLPSANLAIHGISDGLRVRVLSKEDGRSVDGEGVADCTQDCELQLPVGPYRLVTSQGDHHTTKDVDLDTELSLKVSEPGRGLHGLGLGLGITGVVVAALSSLVAVSALAAPAQAESVAGDRNTVLVLGLAGAAAGSGLIVGGFSLATENRAPSLELDRSPRLERLQRPAATGISFAKTF